MPTYEEVALDLALRAGTVVRRHFGRTGDVHHKGEVDLVTIADREAERLIVDGLRAAYPNHAIVAEESGRHGGTPQFVWYVDPLDGTTNFVHAYPHFAVSIGLVADGQLTAAVVHDPMRGETFHATRGHGARLNGEEIHTSEVVDLGEALVATGFPYDRRLSASRHLPAFERVLRMAQGVRRAGAAALDLAYVASGRLDGYWESHLKPWDTAAGSLLVTEAGGHVSTYDGDRPIVAHEQIVATNGHVHEALCRLVGPADAP